MDLKGSVKLRTINMNIHTVHRLAHSIMILVGKINLQSPLNILFGHKIRWTHSYLQLERILMQSASYPPPAAGWIIKLKRKLFERQELLRSSNCCQGLNQTWTIIFRSELILLQTQTSHLTLQRSSLSFQCEVQLFPVNIVISCWVIITPTYHGWDLSCYTLFTLFNIESCEAKATWHFLWT